MPAFEISEMCKKVIYNIDYCFFSVCVKVSMSDHHDNTKIMSRQFHSVAKILRFLFPKRKFL